MSSHAYAKIVPMKVLLISPLDPAKPQDLKNLMGGENTYTRTLLKSLPAGFEYIHYTQALKEKKIFYTPWQSRISFLMKTRFLPPDAGFQCLRIKEDLDLIHCHVYSLKLENYSGPVVLSDSSSNYCFLKDYLGWGRGRIELGYKFRKWVDQRFDLYDPSLNLNRAKKLIVWSKYAKKIHLQLGGDPKKIIVIPPGIAKLPGKKIKTKSFNIVFVGTWFERKGGPMLLEAYKILKEKHPQVKLYLVGQVPKTTKLFKDVWHKDYVPRDELVKKIFPRADVLVLVPPVAEGYGLVVLEAASLGIPAIVTNIWALPEIVEDEKTGFVIPPGDRMVLVNRLEKLINSKALAEKMGESAKKRFLENFEISQTNKKLLEVYRQAMQDSEAMAG